MAKSIVLTSLFTPATPVSRKDFFAGRLRQVATVVGAVRNPGQHAVIYGERGVGKTSLAGLIYDFWQEAFRDAQLFTPRVNCDADDSFQSLWRKIVEEIQILYETRGLDFHEGRRFFNDAALQIAGGDATPTLVRRLLELSGREFAIIIDEFDRVEDPQVPHLMADTIKAMADQRVDATLVIVGVADTIDDLIESHASVDRSLVQVHIPRMSPDEVSDLIVSRLEAVGMTATAAAIDRIARFSQGLPHYAHLLGLSASTAALTAGTVDVAEQHVLAGLDRVVDESDATVKTAYQRATTSPHTDALFAEVLLACAQAVTDDLGWFSAAAVRDQIRAITGRNYDIPNFKRHLYAFTTEGRAEVLQQSGKDRSRRYRFRDPLLKAFVRLKGVRDGRLRGDQLP